VVQKEKIAQDVAYFQSVHFKDIEEIESAKKYLKFEFSMNLFILFSVE